MQKTARKEKKRSLGISITIIGLIVVGCFALGYLVGKIVATCF